MNLWGVNVTESKKAHLEVPDDRDLLITRLSLGPGAPKNVPTVVWFVNHDIDEEKYVLGTLRAETCEQFEIDVNIAADSSFSLEVTGPGTVYFIGYFNMLPDYSDEYPSFSDSESDLDSENDEGMNARVHAYMGGSDSSDSEDYEDHGHVEEVSSSDSDIDVEESVGKSPVKQKQAQKIQPKVQEVKQPQKTQTQPKVQTQPKLQAQGDTKNVQTGEKKKKKKNKNKNNQPGQPQPQSQAQAQPQPQGGQTKPKTEQGGSSKKNKKKRKEGGDGQGGNPNKKQKTNQK